MQEIPEISVIIPAYNASQTVGAAIDSVLAQTFPDFELLVIDDGSRDDTSEVVRARDDPRLQCVRTQNGGVSVARNRALELAAGPYVAFLDADDAWRPTKLERQHAAMNEKPGVGVCFSSAQLVDDALRPVGVDLAVPRTDYTEAILLEGNVVRAGGTSVLARTSMVHEAGGFDPRLSQCADWDLWLRMSLFTRFLPLHEPLVVYRIVGGTMSSDPELLERDTFTMLDKFYGSSASAAYNHLRKRAYANRSMVCAGTYLHAGRLRDSMRCVVTALRSDPRAAGRLVSFPVRWADRARRRIMGQASREGDVLSKRL